MSADLEAHLRADLDDREAWLVYGDLLLQRGDERGELVAFAYRQETRPMSHGEYTALQERHREIRTRREAWDGPPGVQLEWRHGFAVEARFAQVLDPESPPYVPSHDDIAGTAALLLGHPLLASLDLGETGLGDEDLAALVALPAACRLTALHLQRNRIGAAGVRALATSPHARELRVLDLRRNAIGAEGARALADSPHLSRLRTLHLHLDDIGPEGARHLARSPRLPASLRRFWMGR